MNQTNIDLTFAIIANNKHDLRERNRKASEYSAKVKHRKNLRKVKFNRIMEAITNTFVICTGVACMMLLLFIG